MLPMNTLGSQGHVSVDSSVHLIAITGLPEDANEREIFLFFRKAQGFERAFIRSRDAMTCGFALFRDAEAAINAIRENQNQLFDNLMNTRVHLELAKSNTEYQTLQKRRRAPSASSASALPAAKRAKLSHHHPGPGIVPFAGRAVPAYQPPVPVPVPAPVATYPGYAPQAYAPPPPAGVGVANPYAVYARPPVQAQPFPPVPAVREYRGQLLGAVPAAAAQPQSSYYPQPMAQPRGYPAPPRAPPPQVQGGRGGRYFAGPPSRAPPRKMSTLWIANLPFHTAPEDFEKFIREKGVQGLVKVKSHPGNSGILFAGFQSPEAAAVGLQGLNGVPFQGRVLKIEYARTNMHF